MPRGINASFLDAMAAEVFEPLLFVEMEFDSGNLYMWNGIGEKTISDGIILAEDGYPILTEDGFNILTEDATETVYTGVGNLISVSEVEETTQVVARGMKVSLSGIPASLVSLALSEPFQGRSCVVRWGRDGSSTTAILFKGFLDTMDIDEGSGTAIISVNVENELAALDKPVQRFYSDASQKSRYPNDEFFNFVADLGDKEQQWGGG